MRARAVGVGLILLALALPTWALAGDRSRPPSPSEHASSRIGAKCFQASILIAGQWICAVGHRASDGCFVGTGFGGTLDPFAVAESFGHLYVDDPHYRNAKSFQYNYALAYTNVNFFVNVTHRVGHYHGGGFPGGTGGIGGGFGHFGGRGPCDSVWPDSGSVMAHRRSAAPSRKLFSPGHRSPATVVTHFVRAFNHQNRLRACSYAKPSLQIACRSAFRGFSRTNVRVRHFKIVSTRRNGARARVKVSGTGCLHARCRPLGGSSGGRTVRVKTRRLGRKWYIR
jgi:hypothetical protein